MLQEPDRGSISVQIIGFASLALAVLLTVMSGAAGVSGVVHRQVNRALCQVSVAATSCPDVDVADVLDVGQVGAVGGLDVGGPQFPVATLDLPALPAAAETAGPITVGGCYGSADGTLCSAAESLLPSATPTIYLDPSLSPAARAASLDAIAQVQGGSVLSFTEVGDAAREPRRAGVPPAVPGPVHRTGDPVRSRVRAAAARHPAGHRDGYGVLSRRQRPLQPRAGELHPEVHRRRRAGDEPGRPAARHGDGRGAERVGPGGQLPARGGGQGGLRRRTAGRHRRLAGSGQVDPRCLPLSEHPERRGEGGLGRAPAVGTPAGAAGGDHACSDSNPVLNAASALACNLGQNPNQGGPPPLPPPSTGGVPVTDVPSVDLAQTLLPPAPVSVPALQARVDSWRQQLLTEGVVADDTDEVLNQAQQKGWLGSAFTDLEASEAAAVLNGPYDAADFGQQQVGSVSAPTLQAKVNEWQQQLVRENIATDQTTQVLNQAARRGWLGGAFSGLTAPEAAAILDVRYNSSEFGQQRVGVEIEGDGSPNPGPAVQNPSGSSSCPSSPAARPPSVRPPRATPTQPVPAPQPPRQLGQDVCNVLTYPHPLDPFRGVLRDAWKVVPWVLRGGQPEYAAP